LLGQTVNQGRCWSGFLCLESGEKTTVSFTLTPEDFACYDVNMKLVVEPGIFEVTIGSSWEDIYLRRNFEVKKTE